MKKCVGCGYCCIKAKCAASQRLYPDGVTCPQLLWQGDRYMCGLMLLPGVEGATYRKELAAGERCCSGLNSWRKDVRRRNRRAGISGVTSGLPRPFMDMPSTAAL